MSRPLTKGAARVWLLVLTVVLNGLFLWGCYALGSAMAEATIRYTALLKGVPL